MSTFEGVHLIADFGGIPAGRLADPGPIMDLLAGALAEGGDPALETKVHRTAEGGFAAMVLLAGGHLTVHAFPPEGYLALEVFSCGPLDPDRVSAALAHMLAPCAIERRAMVRRPPRPRSGPGFETR